MLLVKCRWNWQKATPLVTDATPENETNEILASLYRHFEELHSTTSKPFSVIVHGDVRPENVTFTPGKGPFKKYVTLWGGGRQSVI